MKDNSRQSSYTYRHAISALVVLVIFLGTITYIVMDDRFKKYPKPLRATAAQELFSEGRAMRHVIMLADVIGNRQEGSPGIILAAEYLKTELKFLKSKAASKLRFEIDVSLVTGSFNIDFLTKGMTMVYQNLTNIAVRLSRADSSADTASVLVNGHFDSALYSPGASDCAACVACMLEVIRLIVHTNYLPPSPLIFLFNGGEEIFLKAAHGFVSSHPWAPFVGAVINLESSGSALPDILLQSGPSSWPSEVYSRLVPYPAGSVVSGDIFPYVPGDTDYRIFCSDFDDAAGLDLAYLLGGHAYHTGLDTAENLQKGAMQTRGENLVALVQGLAASAELKTRAQRRSSPQMGAPKPPVYFDFLGLFCVQYSREVAVAAHVGLFVALLAWLLLAEGWTWKAAESLRHLAGSAAAYMAGWVLAVVLPAVLAALRVAASRKLMNWLSSPYLAVVMFSPAAVAGLLIPQIALRAASLRPAALLDASNHWGGTVGCNALLAALLTLGGAGLGFVPFWWALCLLPALWLAHTVEARTASHALSTLAYLLPAALPAAFSLQFAVIFVRFAVEAMARSGTHPLPAGPFVPDVIVGALTGLLTAAVLAPLVPYVARVFRDRAPVRALVYLSVIACIAVGQLFPYSASAPKRVLLQQLVFTHANGSFAREEWNLLTADANDASFLLRSLPALEQRLRVNGTALQLKDSADLLALYPVSLLLDRSLLVPAPARSVAAHAQRLFPHVRVLSDVASAQSNNRRVQLRVEFGCLTHVWGAVLNFTGPLRGWTLANEQLGRPERLPHGPPSYMVHYGGSRSAPFEFWVEVAMSGTLRLDMAVLDLETDRELREIAGSLPDWVASGTSASYLSTTYV